ncbi:MAG: AI-2E family transporter [Candidatus Undinarchaeales archaeon]
MKLKQVEIAFAGILALAAVYKLLDPIVFAIIIAYLVSPFFNRLVGIIKNRTVSATVMVLVVLGAVVVPVFLTARFLFYNATKISKLLTMAVTEGTKFLSGFGIHYEAPALSSKMILNATSWLSQVPLVVINLFITLILVFVFLKDGPKLKAYLMKISDKTQKKILNELEDLLHAVVFGYIAAAIIIGVVAWAGFFIIGYEYAILLAILVGFAALIPFVGTWAIYLPLTAYELIYQDFFMAGVLITLTIITVLLEIFLRPALTSRRSKFPTALMFIAFIGGLMFFGFKGILIGPMAVGAVKILLDHYGKEA